MKSNLAQQLQKHSFYSTSEQFINRPEIVQNRHESYGSLYSSSNEESFVHSLIDSTDEYPSEMPPILQDKYAQEFEEISMIGKGGYGTVYKAKHISTDTHYAIKKIQIPKDQLLLYDFTEFQILQKYGNHKYMIGFTQAWLELCTTPSSNNTPTTTPNPTNETNSNSEGEEMFFNMDPMEMIKEEEEQTKHQQYFNHHEQKYKKKKEKYILYIQLSHHPYNLRHYISNRQTIHIKEILGIFIGIVEGVLFLHHVGYLHCDLKPENIFLNPNTSTGNKYDVYLGDFGNCKAIENPYTFSLQIGTPTYTAPELKHQTFLSQSLPLQHSHHRNSHNNHFINGKEKYKIKYTEKSDVYALGMVLFELLYIFETRMERAIHLTRAKEFELFPDLNDEQQKERHLEGSRELWMLVKEMMKRDEAKRPDLKYILQLLYSLQHKSTTTQTTTNNTTKGNNKKLSIQKSLPTVKLNTSTIVHSTKSVPDFTTILQPHS